MTITEVHDILTRYGLSANKALGQNFLIDNNTAELIVNAAGITPDALAIEVGPGLGALTRLLSERAESVVAVELDRGIAAYLNDAFTHANVTVVHADILRVDLKRITERFADRDIYVVSNLPYYITADTIFTILHSGIPWRRMTLMVQDEVADRLRAKPGDGNYGAISVGLQFSCDVTYVHRVPPTVFYPQPKVHSAVISLTPHQRYDAANASRMRRIVAAAFGQRRKTLVNALCADPVLALDKSHVAQIIGDLFGNDRIRGEALSVEDFVRLSNAL